MSAIIYATNSVQRCSGRTIHGSNNIIHGDNNTIVGHNNVIHGKNTTIKGHNNVAHGPAVKVTGHNNVIHGGCPSVVGHNNDIHGSNSSSNGANNRVNGTVSGGMSSSSNFRSFSNITVTNGTSVGFNNHTVYNGGDSDNDSDGFSSTYASHNYSSHPGSVVGNGVTMINYFDGAVHRSSVVQQGRDNVNGNPPRIRTSDDRAAQASATVDLTSSPVRPKRQRIYPSLQDESLDVRAEEGDTVTCSICMENKPKCTIDPCGHCHVCIKCIRKICEAPGEDHKCPTCREKIDKVIVTYN